MYPFKQVVLFEVIQVILMESWPPVKTLVVPEWVELCFFVFCSFSFLSEQSSLHAIKRDGVRWRGKAAWSEKSEPSPGEKGVPAESQHAYGDRLHAGSALLRT